MINPNEPVEKVRKKPGPKPGSVGLKADGTPRKKPGPKPGLVTLKADGTPKKKPGPKPGSKRTSKPVEVSAAAVVPKKRGPKPGFKRKSGRPKAYPGTIGQMVEAARMKVKELEQQLANAVAVSNKIESMAQEVSALGL
jgi:hypothetical protein